jgi:hypothetical protein
MTHLRRFLAMVLVVSVIGTLGAACATAADTVLPTEAPSASGANEEASAPVVELGRAGDEFGDPASLAGWTVMQGELQDGTPGTVDIGRTNPGALTMVPGRSWWVNGTRGLFVYQQLRGDFVVTARVRVSGKAAPLPAVDWSLAGLLLRAPSSPNGSEHWVGYTVGFVGAPRVERKTTKSSRSELRLIPVEPGWIELRAVRAGALVILLRRQGGTDWTLDAVYERADLPETLQVGIDAQSGYEADRADLVAETDWVHAAPTGIPDAVLAGLTGQLSHAVNREEGNTLTARDTDLVREALLPTILNIP